MNECDFMKSQIQIYSDLAESLSQQIKRQREDFFHKRGNPNSIEAKKINFARAQAEIKLVLEKEDRLKAAHALRLALKAQEALKKMELEREKQREEEYYYYQQLIKQKPIEARENLIDKIKQLMAFFNELLGRFKFFIKELTEQIERLKTLKKTIINNEIVPLVHRIREDLTKQIRYFVDGAPVDLSHPLEKLFNKFIAEVQAGTISMANLKDKWCGAPYVDGHIISSLENTPLKENDKKIVRDEIWSTLQKHAHFDLLKKGLHKVAEIENKIKPLEQIKGASEALVEKVEDVIKDLSDVARSTIQKVEDYVEIDHLSKEVPKMAQHVGDFVHGGVGELMHIQKTLVIDEKKSFYEEEPQPIVSHRKP